MRSDYLVTLLAAVAAAPASSAQCAFSTSIVETFRMSGNPVVGQQQNPDSGWTYERTGSNGTQRILLEGVLKDTFTGGAWGSPSDSILLPTAGPRYSPDLADNQNENYRRPPSFNGILLHPSLGPNHARAVLTAQTATTLTSILIRAENLGRESEHTRDVVVTVLVEAVGGGTVILIPATSVFWWESAVTLRWDAGTLPVTMGPGDRLVVESSDGGSEWFDWLNIDARVTLSGPPLIATQPRELEPCVPDATILVVTSGAASHRWRKDGIPLMDGPTGTRSTILGAATSRLRIVNFDPADVGRYDCVVENTCGSVTSTAVLVNRCFADFTRDCFLDFFDYKAFVGAFENGEMGSDFNGDGFLDFFDYDDFVRTFEVGC